MEAKQISPIRYPKPPDFEPVPTFGPGHRWAGHPRCKAWARSTGRQCSKVPMEGFEVCRMHGAKGGRPPKHAKFTIPSRYAKAFQRAIGDGELHDLRTEAALSLARLSELMDEYESLDRTAADFAERESALWADIRVWINIRRQLVESMRAVMTEHGALVPLDVVLTLTRHLVQNAITRMPDRSDRVDFIRWIIAALPSKPSPGTSWGSIILGEVDHPITDDQTAAPQP